MPLPSTEAERIYPGDILPSNTLTFKAETTIVEAGLSKVIGRSRVFASTVSVLRVVVGSLANSSYAFAERAGQLDRYSNIALDQL